MTPRAKICGGTISLTQLTKAFKTFCEGHKAATTQLEKDGVYQRFEYSFEMLWKTIRKILIYQGVDVTGSPRDVFRKAHMDGIIETPDYWFTMIKYRNLTAHTYDEAFVKSLYNEFPKNDFRHGRTHCRSPTSMKHTTLHCKPHYKKMIADAIKDTPFELFVFGSRVTGKARPNSDLDLAYYGPQPFMDVDRLEEALFESDLPFTVDVIDLNTCSEEFLEMIQDDLTPLKPLLSKR